VKASQEMGLQGVGDNQCREISPSVMTGLKSSSNAKIPITILERWLIDKINRLEQQGVIDMGLKWCELIVRKPRFREWLDKAYYASKGGPNGFRKSNSRLYNHSFNAMLKIGRPSQLTTFQPSKVVSLPTYCTEQLCTAVVIW
jgi:hypothetical protein